MRMIFYVVDCPYTIDSEMLIEHGTYLLFENKWLKPALLWEAT